MIKEMKLDIQPTTLGIDVGSTTVKLVLIKGGSVEYECYVRHHSKVRETTLELVRGIGELAGDKPIKLAISGSAGYGLATEAGLPFIQEVFATGETVKRLEPDTGVVIELGGEDAKVIFFTGVTDERMNGTCAGGTGAFIDQMASLLNVSVTELEDIPYSIALWRVRQDGHSAAYKPGRAQRRHSGERISGGCESDDIRPCARL